MTKYLTEERFIVNSNDKQALQNYRDNYDRIFGDKEPERVVEITKRCYTCEALVPDPDAHVAAGHHVSSPAAQEAVRAYLAAGGEPSPIGWYGVVELPNESPCEGCDETTCECDEHDPACAKLTTRNSVCDCGRFTRL